MANAETVSGTNCYIGFNGKNKQVKIAFRTYVDNDLRRNVGALVQYGDSIKTIPLVYAEAISTDEKLDNYELHWLEILDRQITGEYVYAREGAGSGISAYSLTYRNFKNGRKMLFLPSSEVGSNCVIKTQK